MPIDPAVPSFLRGAIVALVTPFTADGAVDEPALRRLVERQIAGGTDAIVPCGTTGESATLEWDEHYRVIDLVIETAAGRVPVIAGAGSNDTKAAIAASRHAARSGATALLSIAPYYNKPTQEGYFRHYSAIADAVDLPVVLYNVPGRTASNVRPETILRLAEHPNIVGVKEASGQMEQIMAILRDRPTDFAVLSGDDALALPLIALGADGVISVQANLTPRLFRDLVHAALAGDLETARRLHHRLLRLMQLNFIETNPIPVKSALAMLGLVEDCFRLPLVPLSDEHRPTIQSELVALGLLDEVAA